MRRPTRLEILEYALEGLRTYAGIYSGQFADDEAEELEDHEAWLEAEIARVKERTGQ